MNNLEGTMNIIKTEMWLFANTSSPMSKMAALDGAARALLGCHHNFGLESGDLFALRRFQNMAAQWARTPWMAARSILDSPVGQHAAQVLCECSDKISKED
jgi:hypothetical protein